MASKNPSFKGLQSASAAASRAKRNNKKTGTLHERLLRSELWRMGLRFHKNVAALPGKPDIVFPAARVAVFCDGDFWHGRNWSLLKIKLEQGTNAGYWLAKIQRNMERDVQNTAFLEQAGWQVVRVWEGDVKQAASSVAQQIATVVHCRRHELREQIHSQRKRLKSCV